MFVAEIDATLIRIEDSPLQYQTVYRDVRRAIPRKFPYGVFYRVVRNDIKMPKTAQPIPALPHHLDTGLISRAVDSWLYTSSTDFGRPSIPGSDA